MFTSHSQLCRHAEQHEHPYLEEITGASRRKIDEGVEAPKSCADGDRRPFGPSLPVGSGPSPASLPSAGPQFPSLRKQHGPPLLCGRILEPKVMTLTRIIGPKRVSEADWRQGTPSALSPCILLRMSRVSSSGMAGQWQLCLMRDSAR